MKITKKALLTAGSYAAVAALAVGGTLAVLSDQTETDINTMTVDNVSIEQHEYERVVDENGDWVVSDYTGYGYTADLMQEFTQGKSVIPAVYADGDVKWDDRENGTHQQPWSQIGAPGSNQLFDDSVSNVIDKFVFVENTGETDAYYRTIIAVECPDGFDTSLIHLNRNGNSRFAWNKDEIFTEIDGVRYYIKEAIYQPVLTPGEISRPSFLQAFLDPATTSDDIELLGDTWDILVVSQAVQADKNLTSEEMLDEAFGDITAENHPWSDDNSVKDVAFAATTGEHSINRTIVLADDGEATDCVTATGEDTVVNITGGSYDAANKDCAVWAYDGATVNIYDGTFTCAALDGEVSSAHHSDLIYAGSNGGKINIYGGYFYTETAGDWILNEKDGQGTIVVYGGTFVNWNPADNTSEGAGTNFVADGYTVVSETQANGDVWYTVVAE